MDLQQLEIITLEGERLSFHENSARISQALEHDGFLVLKKAANLTSIEYGLSGNANSRDAVRRDVALNDVSLVRQFLGA
jgi:hypothetical protein